ncbi:MAG: imidazole glycerol phosphate synthase subunit HisH [Deltaproteobacteria bacterium]|nr:imidazole glycerol phosphate synthase subunit HisH [Deltaproteobacteria bacterium]
MIGIIDYRAGNLTSVARALQKLGQPCRITDDPAVLGEATHLIFPGVGAAGEAMAHLQGKGLDRWIRQWVRQGKPLLGICLGTQVIFDHSEENDTPCLGILKGSVRRFPAGLEKDGLPLKIPHMGWNEVRFKNHPVFAGLPKGAEFYFVHSYYPAPADEGSIIGTVEYGLTFCAAVAQGNLVAVQFHPEKSGNPGLAILANFCRWRGNDAQ